MNDSDPTNHQDTGTDPGSPCSTDQATELQRLQEEFSALQAQLQRTLADAANMRRRQQKEMEDSRRRVLEGVTQDLLPVLDAMQMALAAYGNNDGNAADPKGLVDGVRLVATLLVSTLERQGLSEIKAAGLPFDPSRHEAVAVEPSADLAEGHVVRVLQPGYLIGDFVVRHSKVTVSGASQKPPTTAE